MLKKICFLMLIPRRNEGICLGILDIKDEVNDEVGQGSNVEETVLEGIHSLLGICSAMQKET